MSKIEAHKELIKELADLLDKSSLTEIEIEEEDLRIRVARDLPPQPAVAYSQPVAAAPTAPAPAPAAAPAASEAASEAASGQNLPEELLVRAPMVGTVYQAPAPGEAPFVKVGDAVKAGDTIAIIEAMKVMNQITAHKAGTVTQLLFQDAQPVEYDEALCVIE